MFWMVFRYLFLSTFCIVRLKCEVQQDRPKIKTSDGDLILEPGYDKNIYLRPNGPKSNVFVGELNLLNINTSMNTGEYQPSSSGNNGKNYQEVNEILERLQKLENQQPPLPSGLLFNITILARKINRLNNRVSLLQSRINGRINNCQANPCKHGGTCLNLMSGYYCLCPPNWEGTDCDEDVNECRNFAGTDLGCQNGATCINKPGSYDCLCRTGWFGLHCTRKAKDCSGGDFEMCGHGTCLPVTSGDGIKCICDQGWTTNGTGIACLTDINECESSQGARCSVNPRVECINLPGSFRCGECPSGYEGNGYVCYDIDECVTLPNGGCSVSPFVACHNTIGSRSCGPCPPGYLGDGVTCTWIGSCNINHGGCHPAASCVDKWFGSGRRTQCICPNGMDGDGVGLDGCYVSTEGNATQHCESNPCGVHGQCHALRTGYTCICHKGFTGVHCENTANLCANYPCRNGGSCIVDENSSRGFRCECTALFSGDLCQSHSNLCGGVLNHEEGSIIYPISNTTYSHNARCAWVIHTSPDKVINVTFSKFNLETNPECQYDFLQIHDGRSSASQLLGRFCGNTFPLGGNIISSHNNLYFWFRSDQTVAKDGFALHWTSIDPVCGGEIDASTHGHITSPGSRGKYPPNRDCYWHLTTTFGKRILLHFFELDIESHPNCSFDYVAIYDGGHITDPLLEKYCNSTLPGPVQSVSSELLIHFHSDAYGSGYGFRITFAPVEGIPGCGGYFTEYRGEISSPTYNGKYLNNIVCEYKIKTSEGTKIRINFITFSIESSFRCKYDSVKIYDGPSSDSRLVGKFCGKSYLKSYTSSSNALFIRFKSDHTMASEGFRITYEAICHKTLYGDSGVIKSPGYPFSYPENRVCEYIISTTPGKAIQLTFQDFDIESNRYSNCQYDNVEIRDGPDINSTLLGTFCGGSEHIPPVQTSTFNYMYIRFKSDMSVSGTGFYANYTTIDTECGGIHRETTGEINHPSATETNYKNDQTCTWILIAPEGMHIKLTWNRFKLENQVRPSCSTDYVELYEIDDENQRNLLGRYCGSLSPPALTSSTNRLMIKFESDSSIRDSGFSLSYSFLDEKSHCGGLFVKPHGYIYSPGWPNTYEPNRDCIWTITVPFGQQIMLNISQFDLERPIRDKCDLGDFLEIKNGASENTPLIGKYCGSFKSKRILSTANSLYLHFHSDYYLSGRGFIIEWDGSITGCGGTLTSISGSISSPNYPDNYNENAECFYRIVTSSGSRIRISFTELDLEKTPNCRDDYIEIFDGRDTNAVSLGKHCSMSSILSNIVTTTNYAYIKFRSDIYLGGKGFLLNYETICQCNISGSYGVIESPGFPSNYPLYSNCLWKINVPRGNKINITFTHFNVLKSFRSYRPWLRPNSIASPITCDSDYVQIMETSDTTFTKKLCGTSLPKPLTVQSNSVQIKFVSGGYFPRPGFRLEWVRDGCGGRIQKRFGTLSLDKSLTVAENEIVCEWIIETPLGTNAAITFTDLYMMDSKNCTVDAIEVYNGQTVDAPLLTKICHRDTSSIQGSSNFIVVKFVKQSSLRNVFFHSHFDSFRNGCGGKMQSRTGMIYSKNYPKNYDDDLDCIWSIIVPRNHRIKLNILDFDLYSVDDSEDTSSCGDLVRIYEGDDVLLSNYTYRLCPKSNITQVISKDNRLTLQFITNDFGTAKGFKASFTMTCGAYITAHHDGIISNDHFVKNSNESCTWTLLAPKPSQKIKLTITHMSLSKDTTVVTNRACPSTYLRVLDGDDDNSPLIDEFCGNKIPPMIVSHGSAMTIKLGTYVGNITGKFSAHYSTLTSACGGVLTSEEGTIASPNYPQSYPFGSDCEWILSTSPGNRVYITFEKFDIEYSEGCNEDYLEVRENNGGGQLIGVFCGSQIPTNTTAANKLYIKFHSDSKDSGQGFLIHYGFLHGNEISGLSYGEVSSPMYPFLYDGQGEYTWRISTIDSESISLRINQLEIPNQGTTCQNHLAIYDGYNDEAPLLQKMCGILSSQIISLKTSSSVVYIKLKLEETNSGSLFHLSWAQADNDVEIKVSDKVNCGSNRTESIAAGRSVIFNSPNYPEPYENNLNCEWVFKSTPGRHLVLTFQDFSLEETQNCFADHVSIFSSNTLDEWVPLKENICENAAVSGAINASTYLKIQLKTDSSISQKGFSAKVASMCGGFLFSSSGVIEPTWTDSQNIYSIKLRCEWMLKVRPGRYMRITFENFNITNPDSSCSTYVIIRNGESRESPLLADGKYCGYSHENRNEILSSSNAVFVSYVANNMRIGNSFRNFKLRFEERNIECGGSSTLDFDHKWEIITSPAYPSVPSPYTECIWVFMGPPGEILRIDFIDRFDLERKDSCSTEFVEIRDGSSNISPLKGRYCGERPGTIKSSNNLLYIKYSTQISEPRNGFKANISIDVCGGTIIASNGELTSPGYPHMQVLPYGSACSWHIIGPPVFTLKLQLKDLNLPESQVPCATKLSISEKSVPVNNTITILKEFCNDDIEVYTTPIESFTNEVIVTLFIGKSNDWDQISENRGFRMTFRTSRPTCGGTVTTPEGYLTTPGYPRLTTLRFCQWKIKLPDTTRRVHLELLDFDTDNHRIGIYNDLNFQTLIQSIPDDNYSPTVKVFESSGSKLGMYLWLKPLGSKTHRFKAQFTSNYEALCGGTLNGKTGELASPEIERSYNCEWHYSYQENEGETKPNTILIHARVNSSSLSTICRYTDSRLNLKSTVANEDFTIVRTICGNNTDVTYRLPSSVVDFKAIKNKDTTLSFLVKWSMQPCGGVVYVNEEPINVLNLPNNYNGSLDCAWIIIAPTNNKIEIKLEGEFQFDCSDEYIEIGQSLAQLSTVIGEYCKDKIPQYPLITTFKYTFVQYHTKLRNNTKVKLTVKTAISKCGGLLTKFERQFSSPNFPKNYFSNEECVWEIKAELGYRISLKFIERFVIEDRPNCTKDVLIVYDWKDNEYIEIAKLCGRRLPPAYNSTFNQMKVIFRTDAEINLDGFRAQWTDICGGNYIATENEQLIYSPGYNNEYVPSQHCEYRIQAVDNNIKVKFLSFDIEGTYPLCEYDNVTITAHSPSEYIYQVYCGKELPPLIQNVADVQVLFSTDRYSNKKGFKLAYSIYSCGGKIYNNTVITFDKYEHNLNCTWIIEAPVTKIVVLRFLYIDLESNSECYNDYIAAYNGLIIDPNKRLALMCGRVNSSTVIKSASNEMLLQFVTDSSVSYKGFQVEVIFTFSESAGCGGQINLAPTSSQTLKSPLIGNSVVYESYLDCSWYIKAPEGYVVSIEFISFHISSCHNVNQTALGISKCDCDLVEIRDGINPDSLIIDTFCGHTLPPQIHSSLNHMLIRLKTDGEIASSGFEITLTAKESICGRSLYPVSHNVQILKSPRYDTGYIPRGLHCSYRLDSHAEIYSTLRLTVKNLDLRPGSANINKCNYDRLLITSSPYSQNISIGKEFILNPQTNSFYDVSNFYEQTFPNRLELCGNKKSVDLYITGDVLINLQTTSEADLRSYKGFEIEFVFTGFCGRNYTDPQGRLKALYPTEEEEDKDCYTLITAPENNTIALYFFFISPDYYSNDVYLEIFDGDKRSAPSLVKIVKEFSEYTAVFSTGRNLLLYNHPVNKNQVTFDSNYVVTDKGRGCGGKLHNVVGRVASPMYPAIYRHKNFCEWELETPHGSRLMLHFAVFDLGVVCDQNYVQLVDRNGNTISTYCSETPADYTSLDNYVKIVFITNMNNGGTGWVADFVAVL
ncbi:unnamed protein product [Parnassius mnemosyne]|uniref:Cubilin n=1 Tax=Parnassius mnemosyne TaxID=213953 RepID=A0AAV1K6G9_9NEOP